MASTPRSPVARFFNDRFTIDGATMERLLSAALERGGEFAELFFEHRRSGALAFEDQQVKSSSAALSQGVGIRVVSGEAIGYAYTEDLSLEAMRRAAAASAQIASGKGSTQPVDVTERRTEADRLRRAHTHDRGAAGGQGGADPPGGRGGAALRPQRRAGGRELPR